MDSGLLMAFTSSDHDRCVAVLVHYLRQRSSSELQYVTLNYFRTNMNKSFHTLRLQHPAEAANKKFRAHGPPHRAALAHSGPEVHNYLTLRLTP